MSADQWLEAKEAVTDNGDLSQALELHVQGHVSGSEIFGWSFSYCHSHPVQTDEFLDRFRTCGVSCIEGFHAELAELCIGTRRS